MHNSVTIDRDARAMRPLCQRLQRQGFNGDGRTDRASIQIVTRPTVRPYVTAGSKTDAPRECVRPLRGGG